MFKLIFFNLLWITRCFFQFCNTMIVSKKACNRRIKQKILKNKDLKHIAGIHYKSIQYNTINH